MADKGKKMEKRHGQAALEYLATYGWALLVVLVVVGAFTYFGFIDVKSAVPSSFDIGDGFVAAGYKVDESSLRVGMINNLGTDVTVKYVTAKSVDDSSEAVCNSVKVYAQPVTMSNGERQMFIIPDCGGNPGKRMRAKIAVTYAKDGESIDHTVNGYLDATIEPGSEPFCGDGACQPDRDETSANCNDCVVVVNGGSADPGVGKSEYCGDLICQAPRGETVTTCVADCGPAPYTFCGDRICQPSETLVSCPRDCATGGGGGGGHDDDVVTCTDADSDGYNASETGCGAADCNDGNAAINPGAAEPCVCDGVDDNCDGTADNVVAPCTLPCFDLALCLATNGSWSHPNLTIGKCSCSSGQYWDQTPTHLGCVTPSEQQLCSEYGGVWNGNTCLCPYTSWWEPLKGCTVQASVSQAGCTATGGLWNASRGLCDCKHDSTWDDWQGNGNGCFTYSLSNICLSTQGSWNGDAWTCTCSAGYSWNGTGGCTSPERSLCLFTFGSWTWSNATCDCHGVAWNPATGCNQTFPFPPLLQ